MHKISERLILIFSMSAIVVRESSALVIILLLGCGIFVVKAFREFVIWSVTLNSMIQELVGDLFEALSSKEQENFLKVVDRNIPE